MKKLYVLFSWLSLMIFVSAPVSAQNGDGLNQLETRMTSVEEYLANIPPILDDFATDMTDRTEFQVKSLTHQLVVINPVNKQVSRIQSNTGAFLIVPDGIEKNDGSVRLYLKVGNPNNALFSGLKINLRWGKDWNPSFKKPTFEEWRASLKEGDFHFEGNLEPGRWTTVAVDLNPAPTAKNLEYIECEISLETVTLKE